LKIFIIHMVVMVVMKLIFELLGHSLTHGCLVIYGFTLPSHKTYYNSFSVIGEDLIKHFFFVFLCTWHLKNGMPIAMIILFFKAPCLNQCWEIIDFYEEPFILVLKT
jgi:hypothetical protein